MKTILIAGGSGMVGTALTEMLIEKGFKVIILTRNTGDKTGSANLSYAEWDPEQGAIDPTAVGAADAIVHLAGVNVADARWSAKRKEEILKSRTETSALLVKALREIPNKTEVVVSASAIGWYGPDERQPVPFTEDKPAADNFLGNTCAAWEASIRPVTEMHKRLVILRTGIVLSKSGGAFQEFMKPIRFGVAAILGPGTQVVSWIHIHDLCRIYINALTTNMNGVYNAVSPDPVDNKTLVREIAKQSRPNFNIPVYVPGIVLKLMLGEMSIEVLKSTTVSSGKIKGTGFQFRFPSIEVAVKDLLS